MNLYGIQSGINALERKVRMLAERIRHENESIHKLEKEEQKLKHDRLDSLLWKHMSSAKFMHKEFQINQDKKKIDQLKHEELDNKRELHHVQNDLNALRKLYRQARSGDSHALWQAEQMLHHY